LGSCGDLSDVAKRADCFKLFGGIPFALDMQLPFAMEQAMVMMETIYDQLVEQAKNAVMVGVRLSAAMKAAIGLLPITMAILPGMAKGAQKTKMIVPQTALIGFGLVVFPLLQLPMLGTVMCVMIQVGGTWKIFGAVWLFMAAQISPFIPGVNALGPHMRSKAFKLMFKDRRLPIVKGVFLSAALALIISTLFDEGVTASVNIDDIMGTMSSKVRVVGVLAILSLVYE
jgi:hypothetical protein